VPAFDRMGLEALKPAMEEAMAVQLEEIDAIAGDPRAPTFENTIVALERTGRDLDRVMTYYGIWSANRSTPEFREVQGEMAPKLSEHSSKIIQNQELFARIRAVQEGPGKKALRPDQQRLVQLVYDRFAHNGATLAGAAKERYAEIQRRLAELHTAFANNVLADEEGHVLYLDESQLGGLSEAFVQAAAKAAAARGHEGRHAITNTRSSMDPFLTYSTERALREQVWRSYYSRGDNGDEHDNNALIAEILRLRHERVRLLWRPRSTRSAPPPSATRAGAVRQSPAHGRNSRPSRSSRLPPWLRLGTPKPCPRQAPTNA
jgi:peptidyl-dipeptidase Dcp